MTLGIMQPYFFPNLGHFSLINQVDKWVVFDPVQFIRHGWIERNRILKPGGDWQYIGVPLVKHQRNTLIKDIEIRVNDPWKNKLLSQIQHYKKRAPYYSNVVELIENCFKFETESIAHLNAHFLEKICAYLGIDFKYEIFSEMDLDLDISGPGDWALEISIKLNAKRYINPIGGQELFDVDAFKDNGVEIKFLDFKNVEYKQKGDPFEAGLSIIDVLMFKSVEETRELLTNFSLV